MKSSLSLAPSASSFCAFFPILTPQLVSMMFLCFTLSVIYTLERKHLNGASWVCHALRHPAELNITQCSQLHGRMQARTLLWEQEGAGQGRTWGLLCQVPGEVEERWDAYLQPLALEARASEQSKAVFPTTEAAVPPHPRTNTSAFPKGVSHHSPSEGQALSLAHSRS